MVVLLRRFHSQPAEAPPLSPETTSLIVKSIVPTSLQPWLLLGKAMEQTLVIRVFHWSWTRGTTKPGTLYGMSHRGDGRVMSSIHCNAPKISWPNKKGNAATEARTSPALTEFQSRTQT